MIAVPPPESAQGFCVRHVRLLRDSFRRWTGRELLPAEGGNDVQAARRLFEAPFAVLSHGLGADPLFTYANACALTLFETSWDEITRLPSRLSAEPVEQAERERLLRRVRDRGFIDDYAGVRISRSGRRFRIRQAVVWTLLGADDACHGQAAMFSAWEPAE